MTLLKMLSPADYFSIANGAIGALGILYFIDGSDKHIMIGIALIFVAMFMDGLDGAVARRFGSKHNLGVFLDSTADSVSFCFAPAVFIYMVFYDIGRGSALEDPDNFLAVAAVISIATIGIIRLSIFSFFREDRLKNFIGLPTPSMTFFVLTGGIVFMDHHYAFLPATMVITGLMLLNIPYPKVEDRLIPFSLLGLFSGLAGAILGAYDHEQYLYPFFLSFFVILLYIAFPVINRVTGWPKGLELERSDKKMFKRFGNGDQSK